MKKSCSRSNIWVRLGWERGVRNIKSMGGPFSGHSFVHGHVGEVGIGVVRVIPNFEFQSQENLDNAFFYDLSLKCTPRTYPRNFDFCSFNFSYLLSRVPVIFIHDFEFLQVLGKTFWKNIQTFLFFNCSKISRDRKNGEVFDTKKNHIIYSFSFRFQIYAYIASVSW